MSKAYMQANPCFPSMGVKIKVGTQSSTRPNSPLGLEFVNDIDFVIYLISSLWPLHILVFLPSHEHWPEVFLLFQHSGNGHPCEGYLSEATSLITSRAAPGSSRPSSAALSGIKSLAKPSTRSTLAVAAFFSW